MGLNRCLICHNAIASNYILANNKICKSCFNKFNPIYFHLKIENIDTLIIYEYNDFMKEAIVTLKGYKDIELAKIFLSPLKTYLRTLYSGYILLPTPSSVSQDNKRGFNHVDEIFKILNFPMIKCFYKSKNYKQSSQHKYQRSLIKDIIKIDHTRLEQNRKYLIVDDITTTHSTIRTCIKLLNQNSIYNIKVLVVAGKKSI